MAKSNQRLTAVTSNYQASARVSRKQTMFFSLGFCFLPWLQSRALRAVSEEKEKGLAKPVVRARMGRVRGGYLGGSRLLCLHTGGGTHSV